MELAIFILLQLSIVVASIRYGYRVGIRVATEWMWNKYGNEIHIGEVLNRKFNGASDGDQ